MGIGINLRAILAILIFLNPLEAAEPPKSKNFIYVVPDGYGVASQGLARDYMSLANKVGALGRPNTPQLEIDTMLLGTVRTQSFNKLITDSAAAATAFACGVKTFNGGIAITHDGEPVASVLEAAHLAGMKTGLVVTSRITHATPAGYSAHVQNRDHEEKIAAQQIGFKHPFGPFVDLLMGGGRKWYTRKREGGKRTDGHNLVEWASQKGYAYVKNKQEFDGAVVEGTVNLPFLALFAPDHMAYEIDRKPEEQPSLLDMTKVAIATLKEATQKTSQGYFIMIEASRIDHAGHDNDAASHLREVLMYNDVMTYLKEFVSKNPDTQLLSAADHECGGLTLEDDYNPEVLSKAKHSIAHAVKIFNEYKGSNRAEYLKNTVLPWVGLSNTPDKEIQNLLEVHEKQESKKALRVAIGQLAAKKAGLNWSTSKHTAADVLLHGYAEPRVRQEMKSVLGKNVDNTELAKYIEAVLGLSLKNATAALMKDGTDWMGKMKKKDKRPPREANAAAEAHNFMY